MSEKFYCFYFDYNRNGITEFFGNFATKTEAKIFKACVLDTPIDSSYGIDEIDLETKESILIEGSGVFLSVDKIPKKYIARNGGKERTISQVKECFNVLSSLPMYRKRIEEESV